MESGLSSLGWTKDLETGIDILDEQHHRYVDLLNDFIERATEYTTTPEKTTRLTESLDFLLQYAEEHFATEESIMENTEYPEYKEHQEAHLYFSRHVRELHKEMETKGFSSQLSREVNYYTVEWFVQHILLEDMQLVDFLKAKNWQA